ncbi:C1q domain-containing protein [Archangium gephyra]|uniref:C1q domain-containing protein n=1 Tax=Archangium gephyra TaxID=48 RepID=A0ABX9K3T1_9BACT|nr:hypothetical protein [Archangium gephyra]REG32748.1 C1q domain-containing protein [Archangium gephyra]
MQRPGRMTIWGWLTCLLVAVLLGEEARAEGAEPESNVVKDYLRADPALGSGFQATGLCPADRMVAFSVSGSNHISQGGATLLGYQSTVTNLGGGWVSGGGTFSAPCTGLYVFTVSFVRGATDGGTHDDVFVSIHQNGVSRGSAWAGQTVDNERSTGTHTVALFLQEGDYIQTYTTSQSGFKRRLDVYSLTGHMVKSAY